jgi:hypothetical protein
MDQGCGYYYPQPASSVQKKSCTSGVCQRDPQVQQNGAANHKFKMPKGYMTPIAAPVKALATLTSLLSKGPPGRYGSKSKRPRTKRSTAVKENATSGKSRTLTKKKKRRRRENIGNKALSRKIKTLERRQKKAHKLSRFLDSAQLLNLNNRCAYDSMNAATSSQIDAVVARLGIVDPATGNYTQLSQDQTRSIHFNVKTIYTKIDIANNHNIPCQVDVYVCKCKVNTNESPETSMINNDEDISMSGATGTAQNEQAATNVITYPTDYPVFRQKWKIINHEKTMLQAGDSIKVAYNEKNRDHNPELIEAAGTVFIRNDIVYLIRVQGVVCHDKTATANVGLGDGGIDMVMYRKYLLEYDGLGALEDADTLNNLPSVPTPVVFGPRVMEIEEDQ